MKIPPRSPHANAYAERFVLTTRTEVTNRMLTFGQRYLWTMQDRAHGVGDGHFQWRGGDMGRRQDSWDHA